MISKRSHHVSPRRTVKFSRQQRNFLVGWRLHRNCLHCCVLWHDEIHRMMRGRGSGSQKRREKVPSECIRLVIENVVAVGGGCEVNFGGYACGRYVKRGLARWFEEFCCIICIEPIEFFQIRRCFYCFSGSSRWLHLIVLGGLRGELKGYGFSNIFPSVGKIGHSW